MGLVIKSGVFSFIIFFVMSKTDTSAVFVFMSVDLVVIFLETVRELFSVSFSAK